MHKPIEICCKSWFVIFCIKSFFAQNIDFFHSSPVIHEKVFFIRFTNSWSQMEHLVQTSYKWFWLYCYAYNQIFQKMITKTKKIIVSNVFLFLLTFDSRDHSKCRTNANWHSYHIALHIGNWNEIIWKRVSMKLEK